MSDEITIDIGRDVRRFREELAKIPGIDQEEASRLAEEFARQLRFLEERRKKKAQ